MDQLQFFGVWDYDLPYVPPEKPKWEHVRIYSSYDIEVGEMNLVEIVLELGAGL